MKFKLDENAPFSLKKLLESAGSHQVDSVFHEDMTGIDDHSLIRFCLEEQRILITLDSDFYNPIKHPRDSLHGIIILCPPSQGKTAVINLFDSFLNSYNLHEVVSKVLLVEYGNISVRWDCV